VFPSLRLLLVTRFAHFSRRPISRQSDIRPPSLDGRCASPRAQEVDVRAETIRRAHLSRTDAHRTRINAGEQSRGTIASIGPSEEQTARVYRYPRSSTFEESPVFVRFADRHQQEVCCSAFGRRALVCVHPGFGQTLHDHHHHLDRIAIASERGTLVVSPSKYSNSRLECVGGYRLEPS
jgi:hypothetical protein